MNLGLSGNIIAVPLIVEDEETHEVIKRSNLYLHVTKSEIFSDDPTFINIAITGVYQDGSFRATILRTDLEGIFREKTANVTRDDWIPIIQRFFPIDDDDSGNQYLFLDLSAKQEAPKSHYEDGELIETDDEPKDDSITLSIKTRAKAPVTIGSFKLEAVDFEEAELPEEASLFNWLDLLRSQNANLMEELLNTRAEFAKAAASRDELEVQYDIAKKDHHLIVSDLEQKFFKVLNAKKDLIWNLTKGNHPLDHLEGLNHGYYENSRLNKIDKDAIPDHLDEKYLLKRTKQDASPRKKLKLSDATVERELKVKREPKVKKESDKSPKIKVESEGTEEDWNEDDGEDENEIDEEEADVTDYDEDDDDETDYREDDDDEEEVIEQEQEHDPSAEQREIQEHDKSTNDVDVGRVYTAVSSESLQEPENDQEIKQEPKEENTSPGHRSEVEDSLDQTDYDLDGSDVKISSATEPKPTPPQHKSAHEPVLSQHDAETDYSSDE